MIPIAALLGVIFLSSAGYVVIQPEYTWLDAIYMTVITISGVGYHEVHPLQALGQTWTMAMIALGRIAVAVALTLFVAMVVEGKVRGLLGRRQLERKIDKLSRHVIVCGFGRVGRRVTAELTEQGRDVVVVDNDPDRTAAAEAAGVLYVLGDAQEQSVLETAGIERAETLVATLASDADNVFLTLTVRQVSPKLRVIAQARELSSQDKLLKAGATRVVCPQVIGATQIADVVLRPAVVDFVEMAHRGVELELDQLELTSDSTLVGKTLEELALPKRIGAHVVAVRRADGEAVYHPTPSLRLAAGDTVILIGKKGAAEAVHRLQGRMAQT